MSENQIVDSSFTAFEHLEQFLWPEGAVCPHCGTIGHATKFHGEKHRRLDVQEKECRKQFTVKVGTVFEHGRMPLRRMLQAVYLMRSSKKRVSAHQLHGTAPPSNARSGVQPLDLPLPRRLRLLASEALRGPLEESANLTAEIAELKAEIAKLEASVARREQVVDFEEAGERLSEGFNTYLNTIREEDETSWTKTGQVTASISDRRTQLQIGGRSAKRQLGGTLTLYFLFAYHYALLNLSRYLDCHYPGLAVLDFYPDIAREAALGDRLHLVLGPFVQLALEKDIEPIQVIATSRGLPERPNINFIYLTEVWR